MTDNLRNNIDRNAGFKLVDNKSVSEIVDFDILDVGFLKITVQ